MEEISNIFLLFIFGASVFSLVYSYFIFPFILKLLSKNKKTNQIIHQEENELPNVSVLMSLFNEEKIIEEKIKSFFLQKYPKNKIDFYIGSDNSSDNTNSIVSDFVNKNKLSNFHFIPFLNRQGKPGVINQLAEKAIIKNKKGSEHIFVITDASVILSQSTIFHLAKHFKNEKIGLVDSNMMHTGMKKEGISKSEDIYISREVQLKHQESIISGKMMGPFGGCYALRSDLFIPVPENYLVDDFFLAMNVLDQGKNAINELEAICKESVSHHIKEEYRRKSRISAGNFQNLSTYKHLLLPSKGYIAFNFLSHKALRWLGPFFILFSFTANVILSLDGNLFYIILLVFQVVLIMIIPIFDLILQSFNINIGLFRSIRYFFMMNIALLQGFINYLKGIKSNVWQPTQRPD